MSTRGWALFAAVSALWGVVYAVIKVAVDDGLNPVFITWVRLVIAAAVLLPIAWRSGGFGFIRGSLGWLALFAAVEVIVPQPLIAAGEQRVSSSLTAILIAAAPLFVALIALRFDASERPSSRAFVGLAIGFVGVAALVGIDVRGDSREALGAAMILFAAFCYAVGPLIVKHRLRHLDPRASMGVSIAIAAVVLTPGLSFDLPSAVPSAGALVALAALGLFCTAAAFALYGALIVEVGAGRALVVTYLNPLVALLVGVAFLDERPGLGTAAGLILILGGSWLATGGRLRTRKRRRAVAIGTPAPAAEEDAG